MTRKTILTLAICLVIGIGALSLWRAGAATVISAGYDTFNTPDDGQTKESLSVEGLLTNAAGNPSTGTVTIVFKGGDSVPGYNADTVITRTSNVTVPGDSDLALTGLRLVSSAPVTIGFTDGSSADYSVSVKESAARPSTGTIHFNSDGTFSNSLQVNRQYTFSTAGQADTVVDSAAAGMAAISLSSTGTWAPAQSGPTASAANRAIAVVIFPNPHLAIIATHAIQIAGGPVIKPIDKNPAPVPARKDRRSSR
jgi:hypothetical protein